MLCVCAIPGKVVETYDKGGMQMARVQFGGITREACLEYVPETQAGEYVLVHVGFAISRVDEEEAAAHLPGLDGTGSTESWRRPRSMKHARTDGSN